MEKRENRKDPFCILALYNFLPQKLTEKEVECFRDDLENTLRPYHTRGTLLIATEGINGTICFPTEHLDDVQKYLLTLFPKLQTRLSYHPQENVFFRFKVRIKREIVTMGRTGEESDPTKRVGTYVKPGPDWDRLIKDEDCLVIDTRNDYEYRVGTFQRAINPQTESFVEFPDFLRGQVEKQGWSKEAGCEKPKFNKIAMFCTGGIRCEKSTAYCLDLLEKNNIDQDEKPEVYHLKGGILAYLDQVEKQEESTFNGECYVFDHRVAVQHGLTPSEQFTICYGCRAPLTLQDRNHPAYKEGVSCHACAERRQDNLYRFEERHKQMKLNEAHLNGDKKEQKLCRLEKRQLDDTSRSQRVV